MKNSSTNSEHYSTITSSVTMKSVSVKTRQGVVLRFYSVITDTEGCAVSISNTNAVSGSGNTSAIHLAI